MHLGLLLNNWLCYQLLNYGLTCLNIIEMKHNLDGKLNSNPRVGQKEGNVLSNDAHSTFYLRIYGIIHMVKDHSVREETRFCDYIGYSFQLAGQVRSVFNVHIQNKLL